MIWTENYVNREQQLGLGDMERTLDRGEEGKLGLGMERKLGGWEKEQLELTDMERKLSR